MVNRRGYVLAALGAVMAADCTSTTFGQENVTDRMNQLESLVRRTTPL